MALLAGTMYDPGTAVSKDTATAATAMAAFDTTNLRLTFTVPASGNVFVRVKTVAHGATTSPQVLLGVLEGATVRGRAAPFSGPRAGTLATSQLALEASFLVTGLTPFASLTWDAAWGVETVAASTGLKYGGPNDTTTNNAFGGVVFEIWDAVNLLAGVLYDPATLAGPSTASLLAMATIDTTNLRLNFNAPASGKVLVRMRGAHSATSAPQILLGVRSGATVLGRDRSLAVINDVSTTIAATSQQILESSFLVTGLTPGAAQTWDASYGVELAGTSGVLRYGGPNNTTASDAWGGFAFEAWTA